MRKGVAKFYKGMMNAGVSTAVIAHEGRHDRVEKERPIRPVILAGGAGTRLWPLSTAERPKHLLPLLGERILFEQTLERFGDQFAPPIIVANQAQEADLRAAAGAGRHDHPRTLQARQRGGDRAGGRARGRGRAAAGLPERSSYRRCRCLSSGHRARAGRRRRPARSSPSASSPTIRRPASAISRRAKARRSPRRPLRRKAAARAGEAMLAEGGHYWNAGIFLASAETWREELRRHAPAILRRRPRPRARRHATDR